MPEPGNPQSLNRYAYVYNNPLRYHDPSGHCPWCIVAAKVLLQTAADVVLDALIARATGTEFHLVESLAVNAALNVTTMGVGGTVAKAGRLATLAKAASYVDDAARAARIAAWTSRFAGAGPEILHGVERLAKIIESPNVFPPFRYALQKQLERAEMLYKQGVLQGVEVAIEGGRVDFVLITNELVEFKYWRQSYIAKNVDELADQLKRYQASGRPVILELGRTKTNPITDAYLDKLLKALQREGVNITREQIRIVDLE